ncbi:MAG: sulfotransferase, partial [Desulfobacterales bacterium]
ISKENESAYIDHFRHILGSSFNRYQLLNLITALWKTRRIRLLIKQAASLTQSKPLVKDPLAVCSVEWLSSTFNMDVVVVIRHPAAVVNSYKQLNWSHPFSHFLDQDLLIRDHLSSYKTEIGDFVSGNRDIVDQAGLLWKLLHHMIIEYQCGHTDWHFVRHEDLSMDPMSGFRVIFDKLGLPFDDRIRRVIEKNSRHAKPAELKNPYAIKRSSAQATGSWKDQLTAEEVDKIRLRVKDVADAFYSAEEWKTH